MEIKGYWVSDGFMGHIGNGEYIKFATDRDYYDWVEQENRNELYIHSNQN